MKRMKTGIALRCGFLLPAGFLYAASGALANEQEALEFPPLSSETNSVPKSAESLSFPPLPFDELVSFSGAPEKSDSGAALLSSIGVSVAPDTLPEPAVSAQEGTNGVAGEIPASSLPLQEEAKPARKTSALAALAAAVAELPPKETATLPPDGAVAATVPASDHPPRPSESVAPASGVETVEGIVRVSVFIDVPFEGIKRPEGTAMLRTKGWLRKTFPDLPREFSVPGRVTVNGFDDDERVYRYCSEYRLEDIEKLLPGEEEADNTLEKSGNSTPALPAAGAEARPDASEEPESVGDGESAEFTASAGGEASSNEPAADSDGAAADDIEKDSPAVPADADESSSPPP